MSGAGRTSAGLIMPVPSDASSPGTPSAVTSARRFDVAVIGGGIVGLATAMHLVCEYRASVVVLEAERMLATHQTGRNSGVIHSGLYYRPGSLKAELCMRGRRSLFRFCRRRNIPCELCGKVVVATHPSQMPSLEQLRQRGSANGLADLRVLSIQEIREREPHVAGVGGLLVRETGIVDYARVAREYAEVIREYGGEVRADWRVLAVHRRPDGLTLCASPGEVRCGGLINCGGLQSDRIAAMCGLRPGVRIIPFRGEYRRLSKDAEALCRHLIYPVPDPAFPFLGVHFTRMVGGGVEAGPNAVLALSRHGYSWSDIDARDLAEMLLFRGFWNMARIHWRSGLGEMHRSLSRRAFLLALQTLIPAMRIEDLLPGGAGVRAQAIYPNGAMVDDFLLRIAPRMVHVLNAPSPAATASLAIGRHIAQAARQALGLATRPASTSLDWIAQDASNP